MADADPIGGDVAAVGREARRYQDMAVELRDQVVRLKRIASQDELLGRTADTLREAAEDLSGKMADTVGRFERVGSALQEWVPHLEHAQDVTLIALRRAQEAEHQQAAYAPSVVMGSPSPEPPTDAQVAAERRRVGLHDEAAADLHAARARFDEAVDEHHRRARAIAARLDDAAHDQLTDSGWEQFKGWVHEHAETIKKIAEVLSAIAGICTILLLFFPGTMLLGALLITLTATNLVGHGALAASGDGSWVDVGLDLVGLATGIGGGFATAGIRSAQRGVRAAAARAAPGAAARHYNAVRRSINLLNRQKVGRTQSFRQAQNLKINAYKATLGPRPHQAAALIMKSPLAGLGKGHASAVFRAGGEVDNARLVADVKLLVARYPTVAVKEAAAQIDRPLRWAQGLYGTSLGVDFGDRMLGASDQYGRLKDLCKHEWGGSW